MKKLIAAAIALSMIGTSAMAAPYYGGHDRDRAEWNNRGPGNDSRFRDHRYDNNRYVQWRKGDRFDRFRAPSYRVIDSPRAYRLYNAPRGYHWVRSGNDAVLVGITSGIVSAIIANAIR